jgi:hypothetical protein
MRVASCGLRVAGYVLRVAGFGLRVAMQCGGAQVLKPRINSSWEIGADISLYNGVSFCFFYLTNTNGRSIL